MRGFLAAVGADAPPPGGLAYTDRRSRVRISESQRGDFSAAARVGRPLGAASGTVGVASTGATGSMCPGLTPSTSGGDSVRNVSALELSSMAEKLQSERHSNEISSSLRDPLPFPFPDLVIRFMIIKPIQIEC